jgi:hypothetical protein
MLYPPSQKGEEPIRDHTLGTEKRRPLAISAGMISEVFHLLVAFKTVGGIGRLAEYLTRLPERNGRATISELGRNLC